MAKFMDAQGSEWILRVNVNTVRKVRNATDEDLTKVVESDTLSRLAGDSVLLGDVLWCIVADQAAERKITNEQFLERLEGDALEAATTAFVEALVDFFPRPRRDLLKRLVDAGKEVQKQAMAAATEALDKGLEDFLSGKQSMKLPGVSESTPALSASEN